MKLHLLVVACLSLASTALLADNASENAKMTIEVTDTASLARCAARHNIGYAKAYVQVAQDPSLKDSFRRMAFVALSTPPCAPKNGNFAVNQRELLALLVKELEELEGGK
jgi:hypothetical protein